MATDGVLWECPNCGHTITHTNMKFSAFDYLCPKCAIKRLSDFVPKKKE